MKDFKKEHERMNRALIVALKQIGLEFSLKRKLYFEGGYNVAQCDRILSLYREARGPISC